MGICATFLISRLSQAANEKSVNCRNSDGLTPLLLVTRDVQLFHKMASHVSSGGDVLEVVEWLIGSSSLSLHILNDVSILISLSSAIQNIKLTLTQKTVSAVHRCIFWLLMRTILPIIRTVGVVPMS